jgi:putative two-component system response regulator
MVAADVLLDLETTLGSGPSVESRAASLQAANAVLHARDSSELERSAGVGIKMCQRLYGKARSLEALPNALAFFQRATDLGNTQLTHDSAVFVGILSSDTADFAGAIEAHGRALEIKNGLNDAVGASRSWNNIGSALCGVGRYDLASVGFRHALAKLETAGGPHFSRYSALGNLAQCAMYEGEIDKGLKAAASALQELQLGRSIFPADPFSELLLRRNMIRLMVANGDLVGAERQISIAKLLAHQDGGIRASIAMATSQAVLEIARGQIDIAGTRLEKCLVAARPIRPALRDTLASMVRADEASGNPARALQRLQELSELMYDAGADAARAHIGLSGWRQSIRAFAATPELSATQARLVRQRGSASVPDMWPTLTRLALGNSLQIDPTAAHGARVGALSRVLAQACGLGPIQALEFGHAAMVHDVGIAADRENLLGHLGNFGDTPAAEEDLAHCDAGWRILSDDEHPRILLAKEIAKYHHAWVDGRGHPGGLIGRSIPLHARICSVADAYDNIMHSTHPVDKSGQTIATGLARLKTFSGTRLDPELVDVFVDAVEDETRNEGIELESGHGLTSFHQLIKSLSEAQRYI